MNLPWIITKELDVKWSFRKLAENKTIRWVEERFVCIETILKNHKGPEWQIE